MSRSLATIAREIRSDWKKVYFGAVPYLQAMYSLDSMQDMYYADDARSIVLYFLSNATTWRGPVAKRIKLELKAMLAGKDTGLSGLSGESMTFTKAVCEAACALKKSIHPSDSLDILARKAVNVYHTHLYDTAQVYHASEERLYAANQLAQATVEGMWLSLSRDVRPAFTGKQITEAVFDAVYSTWGYGKRFPVLTP